MSNDQKDYIRFTILISLLFLCCLILGKLPDRPKPAPPAPPAPAPIPPPPAPPAPEYPDITIQLLNAHNAYRAKVSLPPYKLNKQLYKAAQAHADYMAKKGRLAHFGIGDGTPWSRIKGQGYDYSYAGENIAWNQRDPQEATDAWMSDWGHRANVLSKQSTECGLAAARGSKGDWYWAGDYAAPALNFAGQPQSGVVKFTEAGESRLPVLSLWPCPLSPSGMLTPAVSSDYPMGMVEPE